MLLFLSLLFVPFAHPSWEGSYSYREAVENEGEWTGSLTISACKSDGCSFDYRAGSAMGECAASGRFLLSGKKGVLKLAGCVVTLEERAGEKVFVDADSPPGTNSCNELCGAQGARYFGLELRRERADQPSFACEPAAKLSATEITICADPRLAALDRELAAKYVLARKKASGAALAKLRAAQKAWVKKRDDTCLKDSVCLTGLYRSRVAEL